nr:hypothetical protein [Pseudonocardia oroxyli]
MRANAILPGLIATPLVGAQLHADDAARARADRNAASPTGRMGTPGTWPTRRCSWPPTPPPT